jgi:hypothetical protein
MVRRFNMRSKYILIGIMVGVLLSSVAVVLAGSIDSPGPPDSDGVQQMYTLEQIYDRLNEGTAATKMTTFTEPGSGPGSTMNTLNDVMAKAPAPDNTDGATKAQVANGNKYWSLRTDGGGGSSWGLETGQLYGGCVCTCANCSLNGTRWCDNGDGTVTDLTTCLVWLQDASCVGPMPWADTVVSADTLEWGAVTLASILYDGSTEFGGGDCGLSDNSSLGDWRLPTKNELYDLTHRTEPVRKPSYPRAFTDIQWSRYWSSTTHATYKANAWVLEFTPPPPINNVGMAYWAKECFEPPCPNPVRSYMWPVRGGQ